MPAKEQRRQVCSPANEKRARALGPDISIAILAVFLAGMFQNTWLTQTHALELGLAVAVLGPIGDLFESLVKRDAGTKDAGTLFGAHGGALRKFLKPNADFDAGMFRVEAFHLYCSELTPAGPIHTCELSIPAR